MSRPAEKTVCRLMATVATNHLARDRNMCDLPYSFMIQPFRLDIQLLPCFFIWPFYHIVKTVVFYFLHQLMTCRQFVFLNSVPLTQFIILLQKGSPTVPLNRPPSPRTARTSGICVCLQTTLSFFTDCSLPDDFLIFEAPHRQNKLSILRGMGRGRGCSLLA